MPPTLAKSPGTMADDGSNGGYYTWPTVDNAKVSDNIYTAISGRLSRISHYLKATNFGFAIPGGATVAGILVEIEKKGTQNIYCICDFRVSIVKPDGTIGATNKASVIDWPIADTYQSYGGSADKWGEVWTPAGINDVDFGVVLVAKFSSGTETASVDHIRITIYYTEAPFAFGVNF